ncbi:MAG: GDSL-type esterase/lipase family protein [Flavobacteriaceae bacterium]
MKKIILYPMITVLFGCSPLKKFEKTKFVFESEVQALEALTDYKKLDNYLLFLGSSSIRRWNNITKQMAPYKVVKRGYGGAHFYDLIHFTDRLVSPHQKARALICFVANDISGKDSDLSPGEVFRLFKYFTRQVHRLHPGLPIYFIEITPTPSRWKFWDQISKVNAKVQQYAASHSMINFISTQKKFLGPNGRPLSYLYVSDSLHLSDKAYHLWSEIIKDKLIKVQPLLN